MTFALEGKGRQQIEKRLKRTKEHRIAMRLLGLLWLDEGETEKEVARRLGISDRSVRSWIKTYNRGGLDALCTLHYKGDQGELSSAQMEQLKEEIKTGKFRVARQVRDWVERTFGVVYSLSGIKRLLARSGCSFHKTTGFLFKANRKKQKEFLKKYKHQKPRPGEATRRYFVDACHPIWGLELVYSCWLLVGQRFYVGMGGGRKRLSILGAFCPEDHEYLDLRVPDGTISAPAVIELMTKLQQQHPETKKFILYLDNARYHHARMVTEWITEQQQKSGVEFLLEFLPAYSPNLNLIERLWRFLRKRALQQWYPTFEAMQQGVAQVLDHLEDHAEELATLMTEKFRLVPDIQAEVIPIWEKEQAA